MKQISFRRVRRPALPFRRTVALTLLSLLAGLFSGVLAKLLDIYTNNLGNLFSQMSVWIFLCVCISVFSRSPKQAAIRVFTYCIGMLAAYYLTAELTGSVYGLTFVYGWCVFALFSPLFGFIAWFSRGRNTVSITLTVLILLALLAAAILLFDRVRISDLVFCVLLITVNLLLSEKPNTTDNS